MRTVRGFASVAIAATVLAVAGCDATAPAPSRTTKVVLCLSYLSHGAMKSADKASIPNKPSFCVAPKSED